MRHLIIFSLLVLQMSGLAHAQNESVQTKNTTSTQERNFNLELYPTAVVAGIYGGQMSVAVGDMMTVGPFVSYLDSRIRTSDKTTGYSIGIQSTLYLTGQRLTRGLILCPFFGFTEYTVKDDTLFSYEEIGGTYTGKFHSFFGGASLGYQWVLRNGINFSVGGGVTLYSIDRNQGIENQYGDRMSTTLAFGGANPILLGNIGYAF